MTNDSVFGLRKAFKEYLLQKAFSMPKANMMCNDAFLLFNQSLSISFETFLEYGITEEVKNSMHDYFMLSGNIDYVTKKMDQYLSAMSLLWDFYHSKYETKIIVQKEKTDSGFLLNYCKGMRIQYSYKPLCILSILDTASTNGETSLAEIVNYHINYYAARLEKGLVAEKNDSVFSQRGVTYQEARQNLISNALKILSKDNVVEVDNERISFSKLSQIDFRENRSLVASICNNLLETYYGGLTICAPNISNENEKMLGATLHRMYAGASNNEKVIMIHLFGIKYGNIIERNKLSIKDILVYANMPASYYVEIRKGIRLSKYVVVKD